VVTVGQRLPGINVVNADGQPVATGLGPFTLIFFKVSCPTCQLTLPFLPRASRDERIIVVSQDSPEVTAQFAAKFNAPLAYHYDRDEDNYPASNALGLNYVPSMIRVDADGRVIDAVEGFDKDFLEDLGIEFQPNEKVPNSKPG
jgi:hypothetical protein